MEKATEKNSFLLYHSYAKHFKKLSDEQLGKLIRAIMQYEIDKTYPDLDDLALDMAFSFMVEQLEIDREKYQARVKASQTNGKQGGRPKGKNLKNQQVNLETQETDRLNSKPKKPVDVNDDVDVDEEDKEEDNPPISPQGEEVGFDFAVFFAKKYPVPNAYWKDELISLGEEYPQPWLEKATECFLAANANTINYLKGTLQNWQQKGGNEPWETKSRGQPKNDGTAANFYERMGVM